MTQIALQHPKSIVVATDFSPPATLAVEQAARLAAAWGSELHVLHACRAGDSDPALPRARLDKLQKSLADNDGVQAKVLLRTGRASVEIIKSAREVGADLVVVGEHAEGWLKDRFIGGTALKVLREAKVPVLLVRGPVAKELRKIMVATDFSDNARRAAQVAAGFFPRSQLLIQHACPLEQLYRMRLDGESPEKMEAYRNRQTEAAHAGMARFREQLGLPADVAAQWNVACDSENPISILLELVQKEEPDLLVLGKHGGSEMDEQIFGSATENLLYHADTRILLVP